MQQSRKKIGSGTGIILYVRPFEPLRSCGSFYLVIVFVRWRRRAPCFGGANAEIYRGRCSGYGGLNRLRRSIRV